MNPLLRAVYGVVTTLVQPLLRRKLRRRAQAEPVYAHDVPARFGHYGDLSADVTAHRGQWLWLHAVSLGEARVAALLLPALRHAMPGVRVLLTHSTATGWDMGRSLLQPGDHQTWLPWDAPAAVQRFLQTFQPRLGVLLETEVWPELTAACADARVPLWLVNARLSAKSLRNAQRLGWLARPTYAALTGVLAQTDADAERLRSLGAPVQAVLGNIKFDVQPDAGLLAQGQAWRARRDALGLPPVALFAISREGEEALLLDALAADVDAAAVNRAAEVARGSGDVVRELPGGARALAATPPAQTGLGPSARASAVQWLIVPRHPQRFDEVARLIESRGWRCLRRSPWGADGPPVDVRPVDAATGAGPDGAPTASTPPAIWLGDTLREMPLYYGLAHAALLGGSFLPRGGQNLIEAAACGCPMILGPHTFNFADAAQASVQAGASVRVENLVQAQSVLKSLLQNSEQSARQRDDMSQRALAFVAANAGAAQATAQHIRAAWPANTPRSPA